MKKIPALLMFVSLFSFQHLFADCDGNRYAEAIFDVQVTSDIQYGFNQNSSTTLRLDLYEPEGDTHTNRPLMIMIHGGSFLGGSKSSGDMVYMAENFAKRGYVSASISYSLGIESFNSKGLYRAVVRAIHDAKAAVRFFRKEASTYGIDTDRIFIGGMSAGAITALHVGFLSADSDLPQDLEEVINEEGGMEGDSGNDGFSSEVSGVFNIAGAIGDAEWIVAGDVPVVSVHADGDDVVPYGSGSVGLMGITVPVDGSEIVHQRALDVNIESDLYTYNSTDHNVPVTGAANLNTTFTFGADFMYNHVCALTNVRDLTLNPAQINVYPNPTQTYITIDFSEVNFENAVIQYTFSDITGKIIKQGKHHEQNQLTIDIQDALPGVYLLSLQNNASGEILTERVIVK